jgi:transcription-repair coupling factor (superfamily II helicase)
MTKPPDLLDEIAASPPIAGKLKRLRAEKKALAFDHVVESAQPFLTALLARHVKERLWIVCANMRTQEVFHNELLHWHPDALFFPETDRAPMEGALPDPETAAERLLIIQRLANSKKREIVVLTRASLDEEAPAPAALKKLEIRLARGTTLDRDALIAKLTAAGYEHAAQVSARGQFAVRGGIFDVFSFQHTLPVRVELFGDEIESLREFDLDTQASVRVTDTCTLLLGETESRTVKLREYIGEKDVIAETDAGATDAAQASPSTPADFVRGTLAVISMGAAGGEAAEDFSGAFLDHGLGEFDAGDFVVDELKRERFFGQLKEWRESGWRVHIFCNNEGEIERLRDLVPPVEEDALRYIVGTLARGFVFPAAKIAVLSDAELFGRYRNTRARRMALRRAREQANRAQIDFTELNEDDLVVHLEHGIGRYEGMKSIPAADGKTEEVLVVAFADDARVYVPTEQAYLISRYVGVGRNNPPLSALGDGKWAKAKKSAEKAVFDYASRLLSMHAERETAVGFAFPEDNKWQREFEASFLFKETVDQLSAINATKADMENERPMDRLICGDVGFGKTEVAIRAAFKAVMGGKQVALLVPTTVLAQQHYQTFRDFVPQRSRGRPCKGCATARWISWSARTG